MKLTETKVTGKVSSDELEEVLLEHIRRTYGKRLNGMVEEIHDAQFVSVEHDLNMTATEDEIARQRTWLVQHNVDSKAGEIADRIWENFTSGSRPDVKALLRQFSRRSSCQHSAIRDVLRQLVRELDAAAGQAESSKVEVAA